MFVDPLEPEKSIVELEAIGEEGCKGKMARWRDARVLDCYQANGEAAANKIFWNHMSAEHDPDATQEPQPLKVAFTQATFYRSIQADGAWGRISPAGMIHMSFFNDCGPIPAMTRQEFDASGKPNPDMQLVFANEANIVRQLEVDVVMSLEAAKAVRENLDNFIRILEGLKQQQPKAQ